MAIKNTNFARVLSKEYVNTIPLYCTGYPEKEFIQNYLKLYDIKKVKIENLILDQQDYNIIQQMGFDAISLWNYRRGKGGYPLSDQLRVDGWGRIYKEEWYTWEGIFKDEEIIKQWNHLNFPPKEKLKELELFLKNVHDNLDIVLSLPGLFEKTWQSMGFKFFAKSLQSNINLIVKISNFFLEYVKKLVKILQSIGVRFFIVADDVGYKNREFIPKQIWKRLFFKSYQELIHMIHKENQKVILHSDGYISDMIDLFIELGFDAVQSLEPNSGVNIFKLFQKFENKICFIGNLDITLLSFGTPFQVKSYVKKLIKKAKEFRSPLIISPTQQINSKVNPKNVKIMIDTVKEFNSSI